MAFGGAQARDPAAPMGEINMVPLIDVMLVLLIVFMITAPLLTHAVRINLPTAESEATDEPPETVTLAVDEQGRYYWNDQRIERDELRARLALAASREPQPELHLRADRDTRYQALAEIMSDARSAGVRRMGFVTVPEPTDRRANTSR